MTFDLQDIESRINEGIYGDDRMTDTGRDEAFAALAVLLDEVERLRADVVAERAAVVSWLRECALDPEATGAEMRLLQDHASRIERGEHRREEEE